MASAAPSSPTGRSADRCVLCYKFLPPEGDVETKIRQLACQHKYHADCIKQWLTRHSTCPLCVDDENTYKLLKLKADETIDRQSSTRTSSGPGEQLTTADIFREARALRVQLAVAPIFAQIARFGKLMNATAEQPNHIHQTEASTTKDGDRDAAEAESYSSDSSSFLYD